MTQSSNPLTTDVAIIGAGPVGLFAIFELGMLKMKSVVIDALPALGGQCTALYPEKPIYDIAGFPSIGAADLIANLEAQAAPFSPHYVLGEQVVQCTKITGDARGGPHPNPLPAGEGTSKTSPLGEVGEHRETGEGHWRLVTNKGTVIEAKAVIIAAGCGAFGPNRPPLVGIEAYEDASVHYMVARREDFRDKTIVIAGGGDSAVDWAVSLGELAKKIYVVHRRDKFRAMPETVDKMHELAAVGKVEMVIPYQLDGLEGDGKTLRAVTVKNMDGTLRTLEAEHLLAFFGLSMELGPIANWGLHLDAHHIPVKAGTYETSEPGIYAIGDIAQYEHKLKLILCGFSEAAQAAHAIYKRLYPDVALHFEYSTTKGVPA